MRFLSIFIFLLINEQVNAGDAVKSSPQLITRGREVFLENCIACHGEKGDGKGAAAKSIDGAKPRDFTTGYFRRGSRPEQVFNTISEGSEGTVMPPWKGEISENDRWALVYFVKSLHVKKLAPKKKK